MPVIDIEDELLSATKLKPKKGEDRQAFLHRVIDAVQDFEDPEWKELSTAAQQWVNDGALAIKKDGEDAELNDFPGFEEQDEPEEEPEDEEDNPLAEDEDPEFDPSGEEEDNNEEESEVTDAAVATDTEAPAKKKRAPPKKAAPKAEKKAAPKVEKKAAPKAEKKPASGPKATGIKVQIKKLVLKKPSMGVDEIIEKLKQHGTAPSKLTVSAIRSEFRHSLFVLRDAGMLSQDIDLG